MFKNLSIKARLTIVVGLLSLLLLMIGMMGLVGMSKANEGLRTENEDHAISSSQIGHIASLIRDERLQLALALLDPGKAEINSQTGLVEEHIEQISRLWKSFMSANLSAQNKVIADKFGVDYARFVKEGLQPSIAMLREGKIQGSQGFQRGKTRPAVCAGA